MVSSTTTNAIQLLKEDHKKVKSLFMKFEEAESDAEKREIADQAIAELKVHSTIEEELFYPAARGAIKDSELLNEAEEEHHVVKVLIGELEEMEASDEKFSAKFLVLAENVRHHIKEEESQMFPEVKKTALDLEEIGAELTQRKSELQGVVEGTGGGWGESGEAG